MIVYRHKVIKFDSITDYSNKAEVGVQLPLWSREDYILPPGTNGTRKKMANAGPTAEESSESENENEIEPAKVFHRQLSTHKNVKASVSLYFLLKLGLIGPQPQEIKVIESVKTLI